MKEKFDIFDVLKATNTLDKVFKNVVYKFLIESLKSDKTFEPWKTERLSFLLKRLDDEFFEYQVEKNKEERLIDDNNIQNELLDVILCSAFVYLKIELNKPVSRIERW